MASYPNFPVLRDSTATADDGIQIDRAVNGGKRGRSLWVAPKLTLSLRHILTTAERATLDAFYLTNRALVVAVSNDLATGNFLLASPPQYKQVAPGVFDTTVKLEEV